MELRIITPTGTQITKGVAKVSLPGGAGSFTILRNHAPIISSLVKGEMEWGNDGKMSIEGGMVKAEKNIIKVFI